MSRYLSYTGMSVYDDCPLRYKLQYIDQKKPEEPENKAGTVYGSVMGKMLERFYNQEMWRNTGTVVQTLLNFVEKDVAQVEFKNKDIDYPKAKLDRNQIIADINSHIPEMVRTIQHNSLLGAYAKSEVKMSIVTEIDGCGEWEIAGKADLIYTQKGKTFILDGKGSPKREKYTDPNQLLSYALLYYNLHGVPPDGLGWIFFRFTGDDSLLWLDFTMDSIKLFKSKLYNTIRSIHSNKFDPTPSVNVCRMCQYTECSARLCAKKTVNTFSSSGAIDL